MRVLTASPLLSSDTSNQNIARDLINKHGINPEADRKTGETLLLIQALTNLQGQKLEAEFEKLRSLLAKYEGLAKDISDMAASK